VHQAISRHRRQLRVLNNLAIQNSSGEPGVTIAPAGGGGPFHSVPQTKTSRVQKTMSV